MRRKHSPSTRPDVEGVRLLFLVPSPIRLPHQHKAARFIKAPRRNVALKRPKLQPIESTLGALQERRADPLPLRVRKDIQLIDPVLPERNDPGHPTAFEGAPDLASAKDAFP